MANGSCEEETTVRRAAQIPTDGLLLADVDAAGGSFSKQMEIVEMSPEICILLVGLPARLLRGAMRLPTVLYTVERALVAAELRDLIGVPMSSFKVLMLLLRWRPY